MAATAPTVPIIQIRPWPESEAISFWWGPPSSDGGSPLIKYTLSCSAISFTQDISAEIGYYRATGLTNGVDYTFTLTATNGVGTSPAATFRTVQPGLIPFGPSTITASVFNPSTALITWNLSTIANEGTPKWFIISAIPSSLSLSTIRKAAYIYERARTINDLALDTYWRFLVQAINDTGYCLPFAYSDYLLFEVPANPPTNFSGLVAWYDAADSGTVTVTSGRVTQWSDKSGNNRHATATTAYGPAYSGGGIDFGATTGRLQCTLPMNSAHSVFVVASPSALQNAYFFRQSGVPGGYPCIIYGFSTNNKISLFGGSIPDFTFSPGSKYLISYTYSGNPVNSTTGYYNNTLVGTAAQADVRDSGYTYGNITVLGCADPSSTLNQFGGSFFDFAFYNRALTTSEASDLRTYFINKWSIV